ncbi:F0F1 ATP synthase subunit epsilon [Kordiimonas sp. SCSIO 12610]|uniref:F0F1 ATP synthase subunit epsilon n=1 Tax=Kordiimonas sp. SCSIO 12610 TaxID=2829597 RepID=UPI00210C78EA|nr:F0F1 ATP synthase subunit epsilon [Kordiimonas sp. SCSIO 12610]UTW55819.1 F0F1 ATP synthase subunit epsilon [Kordiimonas sp. SCSIO 12610]
MSDTLHLEIVSPERLLKDAQAAMVVVPGTDGDFGVLPNHAPMMSTIRPGVVDVIANDGDDAERFFVKGGLAQVSEKGLTILAEEILNLDEQSAHDLQEQIAATKASIDNAKDDVERAQLEKDLDWMTALSDVIAV